MLRIIKRAVGIFLLVAILATLGYIHYVRITDHAPGIFGYGIVRVSSDDMMPEIKPGEIIVFKGIAPEDLKVGDVVVYHCISGSKKGSLVVHQLSKAPYEEEGVYYLTARSLSKNAVDDPEFTEAQLKGKVVVVVPFVGSLYDFFTQWYGLVALVLLIIVLFGEDVLDLIGHLIHKEPVEDLEHCDIEDIRQSEHLMVAREKEFESIITDLNDADDDI